MSRQTHQNQSSLSGVSYDRVGVRVLIGYTRKRFRDLAYACGVSTVERDGWTGRPGYGRCGSGWPGPGKGRVGYNSIAPWQEREATARWARTPQPHTHHASRLQHSGNISQRVGELLAERYA